MLLPWYPHAFSRRPFIHDRHSLMRPAAPGSSSAIDHLCRQFEMRILDQPDVVAKRVTERRHLDTVAHVVSRCDHYGPRREEVLDRSVDVGNPPIGDDASAPRLIKSLVRVEAQFVAGNIESDIER